MEFNKILRILQKLNIHIKQLIYVRFPFDSHMIPVRFDLKTFDYVWDKDEAAL